MFVEGKNIKKLRALKGLTQQSFADLFKIKRSSISAYEEGRARPKNDLALEIANHFSISLEAFLTTELTVNQLSGFNPSENPKEEDKAKTWSFPFVDHENLDEYFNKRRTGDAENKQAQFFFPFNKKIDFALEYAKGHSILLCRSFDLAQVEDVKKVVVRINKNILIGFIKRVKSRVEFQESDGKWKEVKKTSLKELWEVVGELSFNATSGEVVESRLEQIEAKLKKLDKYLGPKK